MSNEEKINKIITVLDKVEKFVSNQMPGQALLSKELRDIRKDIKDLKGV